MMISRALKCLVEDNCSVDLVLEKRFWPLFARWKYLRTVEKPYGQYEYTYKLCKPCPCAMVENRWVKNNKTDQGSSCVPFDRVSIFASALGIPLIQEEKIPYVLLSDEDRSKALKIYEKIPRPWIYFQSGANETYRSWPYSQEFCIAAGRIGISIISHGIQNPQLVSRCIHMDTDILTSCAIIEAADLVVTPDSMALHAAAALNKPCVAIFGPIGAKTRTSHYPSCTAITPRGLECVPCWRDQCHPCLISGKESSECLRSIKVDHILSVVMEKLHMGKTLLKQHKTVKSEGDDNVAW